MTFQTNPERVELFLNNFFCFHKFAYMLATRAKTLFRYAPPPPLPSIIILLIIITIIIIIIIIITNGNRTERSTIQREIVPVISSRRARSTPEF